MNHVNQMNQKQLEEPGEALIQMEEGGKMVLGNLKAAALEGKSCVVSISLCVIMNKMMMLMLLIERINFFLCVIVTRMVMHVVD